MKENASSTSSPWLSMVLTMQKAAEAGDWEQVTQLDKEFLSELQSAVAAGKSIAASASIKNVIRIHDDIHQLAQQKSAELNTKIKTLGQQSANCKYYLKNGA